MSAKHSPWPWDIDSVDNEGEYGDGGPDSHCGFKSYAVFDAKGETLFDSLNSTDCCVENDFDEDGCSAWDETARRNLTLAATAPELLADLQHVVRWFDQLTPDDIARYRATIAKATA